MTTLAVLAMHDAVEVDTDVISSGTSYLMESGIHTLKIDNAYLELSKGGAYSLVMNATNPEGQRIRQQFWMTSGTAKGCKNTYTDKQGNEKYLPGFTMANGLAVLATGKPIGEIATEEKVIKIYNRDAGGEAPTTVKMFTDLVGTTVKAAIFKQTVDRTALNSATGTYEPTGETRDENEVVKFFRAADNFTLAELAAKAKDPSVQAVHHDQWAEKNTGNTLNKAKGKPEGAAAPTAAPEAAAKPLFS